MLFGMTQGEAILVAFIFGLIYGAAFVVRLGEWVGERILGKGP
jgi:hypothetical protein